MSVRAVIVDDSPLFQSVLQDILANANPPIVIAGTGASIREAMPHIMNGPPDVVISDLFMPDLKGTALVESISLSVPVTLVTAADENDEHVLHAKSLGTAAVLHKPASPDELPLFREGLLMEIKRVCAAVKSVKRQPSPQTFYSYGLRTDCSYETCGGLAGYRKVGVTICQRPSRIVNKFLSLTMSPTRWR